MLRWEEVGKTAGRGWFEISWGAIRVGSERTGVWWGQALTETHRYYSKELGGKTQ